MSTLLPPDTKLAEMEWVPRNRLPALHRLGLVTLADLLGHYPRRYEDRTRFDRFPDQEHSSAVCLHGIVARTAMKFLPGRRRMFEVVMENPTGILSQPVTCRWFNMQFVQKMISTYDEIVVYGRPKKRGRLIVIDHPEFEVIEEGAAQSVHMRDITPVYPAGDGVPVRSLREMIHNALQSTELEAIPSLIPDATRQKAGALRAIHFPASEAARITARDFLVREEFFAIQLLIHARRAEWLLLPGAAKQSEGRLLGQLLARLPFSLTDSQTQVIEEIRRDLASPRRMNRLLQGDVGAGKTLVALAAMLHTVEAGWQAAIMAPTQILAEQHHLGFKRLLEPLGIDVILRTGSRKEEAKPLPLFGSKPTIVVGTHALLYDGSEFNRLGLVVIDEQHKFGVLQRTRLIERGDTPDVLVMTATPIPRTLTQTLYGDLDVSILKHKPANRGVIQTAVRPSTKMPDVVEFVRKHLGNGRQVYVVYPLVEESDKLSAKAATAEIERWQSLLAPAEVALLHGRMSPEEKESVMAAFRDGRTKVLIATTVIEVGVDVPNANTMIVENAERFGLAQLHQLRGRIGRGEHKSYCILLHDPKAPEDALEKLQVLEQTSDGFLIAEADLRLRGPGDLLGTAQTGLPPVKIGDIFQDRDLMDEARDLAEAILKDDPQLQAPANRHLARHLARSAAKLAAASG